VIIGRISEILAKVDDELINRITIHFGMRTENT
jgi:hypothetical protein